MDESEKIEGLKQLRFLFVSVAAVVTSLLVVLIVLVVLAVGTINRAQKSDQRGEENAKILLEIKRLQVLYAEQNQRRDQRSAHAAAATEKAVARVSAKTDKFAKILKQTPPKQAAKTVVVHQAAAPQPAAREPASAARRRPRGRHGARHAVRPPPKDPKTGHPLQHWEGWWDEAHQQWHGGWK